MAHPSAEVDDELYPNAPLVEAVVEIRFPGNPALECRRDALYDEFEKEFPVVKVPHKDGTLPAMGIYQFASADDSSSILSSIHSVGYSTKKYPGFRAFKQRALPILQFAIREFKIKKLTRLGLRYTNMIQFAREDGCIPVERFLNLKVALPNAAPPTFENFALAVTSKMASNGKLTTRIQAGPVSQGGAEILLVDFDYAREGDLAPADLEDSFAENHTHTKKFFNQLFTANYKKIMQGKVLS